MGENLLFQKKWQDAAATLQECLSIRAKTQPDDWTTFAVESLLGAAILGLKKHAEAEPLLLKGYRGMKDREKSIPANDGNQCLGEAINRLIELYTVMNKHEEVKVGARWL